MKQIELDFYAHDFFSNPNADVHQRVETFASKCPGIYQFLKVLNEDEDENNPDETTWLLTVERFDGSSIRLWKGNIASQEILDAVVKKFIQ